MTPDGLLLEPMTEADLSEILAIQQANPQAAQWGPNDYLQYDATVARAGGHLAGFVVTRETAPGEREVLNLAVHPAWKRLGVGRCLMDKAASTPGEVLFLEVRESNVTARDFYKALGFIEIGRRANYYNYPKESGIVMKLQK
jgi:tRNA threonylcarbamoyladenosine biosynthesis protein TsaB